jgi:hypothetical protein
MSRTPPVIATAPYASPAEIKPQKYQNRLFE